MAPWVQILLGVCAVALTGALVAALLALRTSALRAERVLALVERDVPPLSSEAAQLSALASGPDGVSSDATATADGE